MKRVIVSIFVNFYLLPFGIMILRIYVDTWWDKSYKNSNVGVTLCSWFLVWPGEGATASTSNETLGKRQKWNAQEACLIDPEEEIEDHRGGGEQTARWRIHRQWQRLAWGSTNIKSRETAFHYWTRHPATGFEVHLERYYMLSVKLCCSYSELGNLNALINHRII